MLKVSSAKLAASINATSAEPTKRPIPPVLSTTMARLPTAQALICTSTNMVFILILRNALGRRDPFLNAVIPLQKSHVTCA